MQWYVGFKHYRKISIYNNKNSVSVDPNPTVEPTSNGECVPNTSPIEINNEPKILLLGGLL